MASPSPISLLSLFVLPFLFAGTSHAKVPTSETFKYVNQGEFGPYITEYDASYRTMPIGSSPFQLMWYNTTPGQFFVGLRMGTTRSESLFRWVWDANRGRSVGENATLTFGTDGNLVLADSDGSVAWSTGTANKGVVGMRVLPNGNIVIYDKNFRFLWQSFHYPTDTLLVDQSLYVGGPTKLISRKSETENSNGIYSFVMESKGLSLYIDSSPKPLPYYNYSDGRFSFSGNVTNVTFTSEPEANGPGSSELQLTTGSTTYTLATLKYNATLSILRLALDGNLEAYTFDARADNNAWEKTFSFFSNRGIYSGCSLPSKCGSLGICEDEMCVACPTPGGLQGWSKDCMPPALGSCKAGSAKVDYYKVVGVEQFITRFVEGEGTVKVGECMNKCSLDCKCLGFFYWEESSKCWLAPVLGTLSKVSNSSHVSYIKYLK